MSRKEFGIICDNVIGSACDDCQEPCIMKFSDEEWESYKLYHRSIFSALQEQREVDDDIAEYYRLKNELEKEGLVVEEVVNLNIDYLHRRKKEITARLRKLRRMEYNYTKKLLKLKEANE